MFKIEKNIEVPKQKTKLKYPLSDMKPGESFLIPSENKEQSKHNQMSVISSAHRKGIKITTRLVPEGLRVWCLERIKEI